MAKLFARTVSLNGFQNIREQKNDQLTINGCDGEAVEIRNPIRAER
jgi:hypothetical protein